MDLAHNDTINHMQQPMTHPPPLNISDEANGRGFSVGVKGFLKLLKNIFMLPIDERLTRKDQEAYKAENGDFTQVKLTS